MTITGRRSLQQTLPLIGLGGLAAVPATADQQPHMHAALGHLRAAKKSLEEATADKGGHRARAMQLVDSAIREVELGAGYANRH